METMVRTEKVMTVRHQPGYSSQWGPSIQWKGQGMSLAYPLVPCSKKLVHVQVCISCIWTVQYYNTSFSISSPCLQVDCFYFFGLYNQGLSNEINSCEINCSNKYLVVVHYYTSPVWCLITFTNSFMLIVPELSL